MVHVLEREIHAVQTRRADGSCSDPPRGLVLLRNRANGVESTGMATARLFIAARLEPSSARRVRPAGADKKDESTKLSVPVLQGGVRGNRSGYYLVWSAAGLGRLPPEVHVLQARVLHALQLHYT